jgi:hypothetical protein
MGVLPQLLEPQRNPDASSVLLDEGHIAKLAQSRVTRIFG